MSCRLLVLSLGVLALGACQSTPDPAVRDTVLVGLTDATEIDVASKVAGRVKEMKVREGDVVKAGQELATMELEELKAKLDQVNAAIEAAGSRLKMARTGARVEEKEAMRKKLAAAQAQADLAKKMYDRIKSLRESQTVPQSKMDEIQYQYDAANAQLAATQAQYDMVLKGARSEEIEGAAALVRQAEGNLSELKVYDKETTQVAPIDAEVSKIIVHKGELAGQGYPILTLVDLSDVWATFAVREDRLPQLAKGTSVQVFIPALNKAVPMQITSIAPLGDFATWRATNDKNSFDLKSFEVKARPAAAVVGLRPGMTARLTLGK